MNNMTSEIVLYHHENLTQSTLSQTSNYDNDRQGTIYRHSVPKKLLPLENEHLYNNWGAASFSYAHILCPEIFSVDTEYDNITLDKWIKEARILTDKIQKRGKFAAEREICRRFLYEHKQTMGFPHNCLSVDIGDVLNVIGRKSWYGENKQQKRAIIYDIMYGMYNDGSNDWLYREEQEWLQNKKIQYKKPSEDDRDSLHRKGFVLYHLTKRSKNSLAKKINRVMKEKHKEYLLQRNKHHSDNSSNDNEWSFDKIRLANGKECWLGIKNDRMTSMQLSVYHKPNHVQEVQHSRSNRTHSQSQGPQRQNIQGNEIIET